MTGLIDWRERHEADFLALDIDGNPHQFGLNDTDLLKMYRTMMLTRVLDQKMWNLNRSGKAPFVVNSQGHEAAQVGSAWAIRPGHDTVLPYYRDLGVVLTLGMSAYEIFLAVFARADDPNSGGRQMPNHWSSKRRNIISGSSAIATQLPHAVGLALAHQNRGEDKVTLCYFGDGAASKGDFHESLNFTGIHQLPIVFICENNGYAISVPLAKESAVENIAEHAPSYRLTGAIVDGNDPLEVYAAVRSAVERARTGGGPGLIECKTYRFLGHTSDDDDRTYRSAEEVESWRRKDPLVRMKQRLVQAHLLDEQQEAGLEAEVKAEVDEAARQAEKAAQAAPEMAFTKVFARPLRPIPRVPVGLGDPVVTRPHASNPQPDPTDGIDGVQRTVIETVRQTQHDLMVADERIVILGEDVGLRGGVFLATAGLHAAFGDRRVIDTPLAESSIVGIGIGLALADLRPIAEIQFADFIHAAFDQLVSEAAKFHYRTNGDFNVPLVIRAPWGGGIKGALYHSQCIEAFFGHVAGLKVVVPSTPADVAGLLREAVDDPDPVLFLEHKKTYRLIKGPVPDDPSWRVPIGVADLAREGDDLTIVTYGYHRHVALEAVGALEAETGASVEVLDLRTIAPLDHDAIMASAAKTGRVLVVHEDNVSFGVGAEVAALVAEEAFYDLDAPVRRLAMPDVPAMPFAASLEAAVTIEANHIKAAAQALLEE